MKKILVIEHRKMPVPDRGQRHLAERGFNVQLIAPHQGDPLPDPDSQTAGILVMGGPQYVTHLDEFPYLKDEMEFIGRAMECKTPLLGICLGAQLLARHLGAKVANHQAGTVAFGYYELQSPPAVKNFIPGGFHAPAGNIQGFELPQNAELLATGDLFPNQAFRAAEQTYGFQFHPEVTRPILDDWQVRMTNHYGKPGAHDRKQQDADFVRHDIRLHNWYTAFLDGLYGSP